MKAILMAASMAAIAVPASAEPLDVAGTWLTNRKDAVVAFADCGDGTPCGRIIWIAPSHGRVSTDARNPVAALRSRTLLGLTTAWGFGRRSDGWMGGRLYNPETGQTFDSAMTLAADGRLAVTGCLGRLCLTKYWVRVDPASRARSGADG